MNSALYDTCYYINGILEGGGYTPSSKSSRQQTTRIKSILSQNGWKSSFLHDKFKNLDDSLLNSIRPYNDTMFANGFVNAWLSNIKTISSISDALMEIGVSKIRAKEVEYVLEPLQNTRYSDIQLLKIAVKFLRGNYDPMTEPSTTHFYNPDILSKWMTYKQTSLINVPYSCSIKYYNDVDTILAKYQTQDNQLFYHTTSWGYINSIQSQINHALGDTCLDFGILPGFYLNERLQDAMEWGEKLKRSRYNEIVIFVFSIPTIIPSHIKGKILEGDIWKSVVYKSRNCSQEIEELSLIKNYDVLYGEIAANVHAITTYQKKPIAFSDKKQFVSKTDKADSFLQNCMIGCIVFQKAREKN